MDQTTAMYVAQAIHGIAYGMVLFLVASGLTLIFGMMDILNLAHAAFFMLAAYFCYQFLQMTGSFWAALLLAPITTAFELLRLRLRRAARVAAARSVGASIGGGLAGLLGGAAGGLILTAAPGSVASMAVVPVLAVIGGCCGAGGGAGVGAGLSVAESVARSRRAVALVCGAAMGAASRASPRSGSADGAWRPWLA
jgi:hypothetical protein